MTDNLDPEKFFDKLMDDMKKKFPDDESWDALVPLETKVYLDEQAKRIDALLSAKFGSPLPYGIHVFRQLGSVVIGNDELAFCFLEPRLREGGEAYINNSLDQCFPTLVSKIEQTKAVLQ